MKAKIIWIAAFIVAFIVWLALFTDLTAPDRITKSFADRIVKGMPLEQVEKLLGSPPTYGPNIDNPHRHSGWTGKIDSIWIEIDHDQRVKSVEWDGWSG